MLPRILSRTSILRICAFIGVSTVTCLAQYTGPGAVASTSLDFGPVAVNARSAIQGVTFSFAESETIAHIRVGASGTNGQDFHYAGGTCKVGDSFSVNQQCTMKVTFLPDHVGEIRGAISLLDANNHVFATGFVHGIGNGPRLSFPPGASSTIKELDGTYALTADSVGNVYAARAAQVGNIVEDRIYRISADGSTALVMRGQAALFLTVDGARNFFVTKGPGGGMAKISPDGTTTYYEPTNSLGAIATDGEGTAYVGHAGTIDRVSATGQIFPGVTGVGGANQSEIGIVGLVAPAADNLLFDVSAAPISGGNRTRGKILQSMKQGPVTVVYDGGSAALKGLAQDADGSLVAAVSGTVMQSGTSSIPVLPIEAISVAVTSNGDTYFTDGSVVTKLARSSITGLSFLATSRGESISATLVLTNTGNQPLVFDIQRVQITGPNAASFHIEGSTCDAQTGLLPEASCSATVGFQSNQSGAETAILSAYTNDPAYGATPVTVPLEGINP
jgi:hypothetical protein